MQQDLIKTMCLYNKTLSRLHKGEIYGQSEEYDKLDKEHQENYHKKMKWILSELEKLIIELEQEHHIELTDDQKNFGINLYMYFPTLKISI